MTTILITTDRPQQQQLIFRVLQTLSWTIITHKHALKWARPKALGESTGKGQLLLLITLTAWRTLVMEIITMRLAEGRFIISSQLKNRLWNSSSIMMKRLLIIIREMRMPEFSTFARGKMPTNRLRKMQWSKLFLPRRMGLRHLLDNVALWGLINRLQVGLSASAKTFLH